MTTRETILQALLAQLQTISSPKILRNEVVPEKVPAGGLISLRDGDPTIAALTGTLDTRFADTALIDAATSNTPVELEFGYVIDADHSLLFTAHEVYLPKPKLGLSGPAGVQANFNWQAAKSATAGCMLTVILKNDVESYA